MYEIWEFLWIVTHRDNTVTVRRAIVRVCAEFDVQAPRSTRAHIEKDVTGFFFFGRHCPVRQLRNFRDLPVMNIDLLVIARESALLERAKDTEVCKNNSWRPLTRVMKSTRAPGEFERGHDRHTYMLLHGDNILFQAHIMSQNSRLR